MGDEGQGFSRHSLFMMFLVWGMGSLLLLPFLWMMGHWSF